MKYRKKPVVIDAVRWSGEDTDYDAIETLGIDSGCAVSMVDGELFIDTYEGLMHADFGDWVIKGVNGEIYPCKPDVFAATYEEAA